MNVNVTMVLEYSNERGITFYLVVHRLLCKCSILSSHTVLSGLFQNKLVTEDELKTLTEGRDLLAILVCIQHTKPPNVVYKTAALLDKLGYKEEPSELRGW